MAINTKKLSNPPSYIYDDPCYLFRLHAAKNNCTVEVKADGLYFKTIVKQKVKTVKKQKVKISYSSKNNFGCFGFIKKFFSKQKIVPLSNENLNGK